MANKNLIIWILALCFITTVTALPIHMSFDHTLSDDYGLLSPVNTSGRYVFSNISYNLSGTSNYSFYYNDTSAEIDLKTNPLNKNTGTLCLWLNYTSCTSSGKVMQDIGAGFFTISINQSSVDKLEFRYNDGGGKYVRETVKLPKNEFTHYCFTWNSSQMTLWKNGKLNNYTNAGAIANNATDLQLSPDPAADFIGQTDDLWIFDEQLTDQQIKNIYNYNNPDHYTATVSYTNPEDEHTLTFYYLNVTTSDNISLVNQNAYLEYNNTNYTGSVLSSTNHTYIYRYQLETPDITDTSLWLSFNWHYDINNKNFTIPFNQQIITVDPTIFVNFTTGTCTLYTNQSIISFTSVYDNTSDSLPIGNVYMTCNDQYYEFYNDQNTSVDAVVNYYPNKDIYQWFKVITEDQRIIQNARITIYEANITTGWELVNQRLTNGAGETYFEPDSTKTYKISVYKSGFDYEEFTLQYANEYINLSSTQSYTLVLEESPSNVFDFKVWSPHYFTNRTEDITVTVLDPNLLNIYKLQTDYRVSHGLSPVYEDSYYIFRHAFELNYNEDYDQSGNSNITIYLYRNNEIVMTWNITYYEPTNDILPQSLYTNESWVPPILFIALLVFAFIMSVIIKNPTSGMHTFMAGGVLLSVFTTTFLYLSMICGLYYIMKFVKKVIQE